MRKDTHRLLHQPALAWAAAMVASLVLPAWSPTGSAAAPTPTTPVAALDETMAHDGAHDHAPAYDPDSGAEWIGRPAPPWLFQRWVRGGPLTLQGLRGKVVLVRFWTEECRFCAETLPAIERLRQRDGNRGLVVIGAFHPPKAHEKRTDSRIVALADSLGFGGAIACDQDWKTLDRWWLDGHPDRNWVSASFLIDRGGIVRWVHGGGEYHPSDDPRHHRCDVKFQELEAALEPLLGPRTTATP
ncbi:MAG: TlpA family protein disulfide reductase [Candidatus Eisenbacteria bacterium]